MLQRNLLLRVAGPTVLVSLLLLGLCTATAVYLYRQQATTAHMLDKHVVSRKIDHELETAIDELIAVHRWETAPAIVHRLAALVGRRRWEQLILSIPAATADT